ncbi:hypothetical protein [Prosthecobacter sp.]|uniref:hypothetical protein n=1 Tax=Prosthecobacter sp. TaxID=1965333 RepID=UPI003784AECE
MKSRTLYPVGRWWWLMMLLMAGQAPGGEPLWRVPQAKPFNERTTKVAVEQEFVPTPKQQSDRLLYFSRQIDIVKKELDEWGTMALAPYLFAPAEDEAYTPFKLVGDEKINFGTLYGDYGEANGSSLFMQQTVTRVQAQAAVNADAVAQVVEQAKTDIFRANAGRAVTQSQVLLQQAQTADTQARADYDAARAADALAAQAASDAVAEQTKAKAQVKAASDKVTLLSQNGASSQAVMDAQLEKLDAAKAAEIATGNLDKANTKKQATAQAVSDAKKVADSAAGELNKQATAPIDVPGNVPGPATAVSAPALKSPTEMSAQATTGLGTIGASSGSMPSTLAPTDNDKKSGSFSPMARINAAASASAVKNILSFLGHPEAAAVFDDRRILFAVSSISVAPGWRTKQDFKGVINAQVTASYKPAAAEAVRELLRSPDLPIELRARLAKDHREVMTEAQRQFFDQWEEDGGEPYEDAQCSSYLSKPGAKAGTVFVHAVSPMVDAQNLDLASSIARQDEVALFLAASLAQAGVAGAGNFFSSWSQQRRKDVATRSTLATANSFSTGDHFGFEIGTRLRGLDDDDAKGNKAAQTLDRQTFPVLLILGMSKADAKPHLVMKPDDDGNLRLDVEEPQVTTAYSTHWSRTHHGWFTFMRAQRLPTEAYDEQLKNGRVRDVLMQELAWIHDLRRRGKLPSKNDSFQQSYDETLEVMKREADGLVKSLYGSNFVLPLPARWLMGSGAGLDSELFDPKARVAGGEVTFEPALLRFPELVPAASTVTRVLLRGPNLHLIDPDKIEVTGNSHVSVNTSTTDKLYHAARLLGRDAIAVDVRLDNTTVHGGKMQFRLPYRGKAATAANASTDPLVTPVVAQTNSLEFVVGAEKPAGITAWATPEVVLGAPGADGQVELRALMTGDHLDRLVPAGKIYGPGLQGEMADVVVHPINETSAYISTRLALQRGVSEGNLIVQGTFGATGPALQKAVFSPALHFSLQRPAFPSVKAWPEGQETVVALDKTTGDGVSGSFRLVLQGERLTGLVATGVVHGDGELKGTAKLEPRGDDAATVIVTIESGKAVTGSAYLELSIAGNGSDAAASAAKLYTPPFAFRFVQPPPQ